MGRKELAHPFASNPFHYYGAKYASRSRYEAGYISLLPCYDIHQILQQNTTYIKGSVVLYKSCVLLSNETTCNSTNFNAGLVYVEPKRTLDRRHDTAVVSVVTQGLSLVFRVFGYAIQDGGHLGPGLGRRERGGGKGYSP